MSSEDLIEYKLPQDAYAAFDATSLLNLINERLNDGGLFTDQNYAGSNISQVIQIISYSYHVLLYYLNRTSNENTFTKAQLYENINRIVKLLNYNPKGFQTSILNFKASSTLSSGTYTIPRYSYFNVDGVVYSFVGDATFTKNTNFDEELVNFSNQYSLYQGKFRRNPNYFSLGEDFETIELNSKNKNIDDSSIDVYVNIDDKWTEWERVDNLYLYGYNDRVYQVRYNEKGNYEIKFGNNIYGKKLNENNIVSIYYLESDGEPGEVSPNFLNNANLTIFSEENLRGILRDITLNVPYVEISESSLIKFKNDYPSTKINYGETVENIKENAPLRFKSQNRLITSDDYSVFIKNQFSGLISDVQVLNNTQYMNSHIKYLNDIGLTEPYKESRVLYNNYLFSDSCFFNNVYIYAVPRFEQKFSTTQKFYFLPPTQKTLIKNELDKYKSTSAEIIIMDPVYMAVDLAVNRSGENISLNDIISSKIYIIRDNTSKDKNYIKENFLNIVKNYFSPNNFNLGQEISVTSLRQEILSITGIKNFYIQNGENAYFGLNFYIWNPVYINDLTSSTQNYSLDSFKFPFLWNFELLRNKIEVIDE